MPDRNSFDDVDQAEHTNRCSSSLASTKTKRVFRLLGWTVGFIMILIVFGLWFIPWRQTVSASGTVTSFHPSARAQSIESMVSGKIVRWLVVEGQMVEAGDTLCLLTDINIGFLDTNLLTKLEDLRERTFQAQENSITISIQRRRQAEQRYEQARARMENAAVEISTARVRMSRAELLFLESLVSQREVESAQLNLQKSRADSVTAMAAFNASARDVEALRAEEERVVNMAFVAMQEADVRLGNSKSRINASTIVAPSSGQVVRIAKVGSGQIVKEGEILATVVPSSNDQAVELYVNGRDAAIVRKGGLVAIQFAGFPAFQISGWNQVAVGIFHGRVKVIDAVDDGTGKYRVLVVPDLTMKTWPKSDILRQGSSASGWMILEEVPLGAELWRMFMGFPPQFPVNELPMKTEPGEKK
ncbi:MAG: biotin/lipoyl-binding protein [Ignavibacteria bacterium]|nr:biotin/lipoyl-binding protein [Ignavibacteria bacterium]